MGGKVYYTPVASTEKNAYGQPKYAASEDKIGLRLSEDGETIEAVSCVGRKIIATATLYSAERDETTLTSGETAKIAGAQIDDEVISVSVLWGGTDNTAVTVTVAFYDNSGKMVGVKSASGQSVTAGMNLTQVDVSGLSTYASYRVFLTYDGSWAPVCGAFTKTAA
jgi:hypothetical protein